MPSPSPKDMGEKARSFRRRLRDSFKRGKHMEHSPSSSSLNRTPSPLPCDSTGPVVRSSADANAPPPGSADDEGTSASPRQDRSAPPMPGGSTGPVVGSPADRRASSTPSHIHTLSLLPGSSTGPVGSPAIEGAPPPPSRTPTSSTQPNGPTDFNVAYSFGVGTPDESHVDTIYRAALPFSLIDQPDAASLPWVQRLRQAGATGWTILKGTLKVVEKVSDAFPPLNYAAGALAAVMDRIDEVQDAHSDFDDIARKVEALISVVSGHPMGRTVHNSNADDRLKGIAHVLSSLKEHIDKKMKQGLITRVINSNDDAQEIIKLFKSLTYLIDIHTLQLTTDIHQAVDSVLYNATLNRLRPVTSASFDEQTGDLCMEKTRVGVLGNCLTWATNQDAEPVSVYWMRGMAGTGKSAIARTLCRLLMANGLLGASFFCARGGDADRKDVFRIVPTLVHGLARHDSRFASTVISLLGGDGKDLDRQSEALLRAPGKDLDRQFESLLLAPAKDTLTTSSRALVMVIDALDECSDDDATEQFVRVVLKYAPALRLKIFITSRPDIEIRSVFQQTHATPHQVFVLHDVEADVVGADILHYIRTRLKDIPQSRPEYNFPYVWPSEEAVCRLTDLSGKWFIFAFTACEYIRHKRTDPRRRLERLIGHNAAIVAKEHTTSIDTLYSHILGEALPDSGLEEDEALTILRALGTIVTARQALTVRALGDLLGLGHNKHGGSSVDAVRTALTSLHAVISVPSDNDVGSVTTFHASFADYLTSQDRSGKERWSVSERDTDHDLASRCLKIMDSELHFNIAGCSTSYLPTTQSGNGRKPAEHVAYACQFFADHLAELGGQCELQGTLEDVFRQKFLFWLEVMSILGRIREAIAMIVKLMQMQAPPISPKWPKFLKHAKDFIIHGRIPISRSTAHIYLSALAHAPPQSLISSSLSPCFPGVPAVDGLNLPHGTIPMQELIGHTDAITSVVFSPDGKRVASGSEDHAVRIWDAETGALAAAPLEGHTRGVSSVVFSPDGKRLASGSDDSTVRIWDAEAGALAAAPLEGHTRAVNSLVFSPDGKRVASGSYDSTVRIWDTKTGTLATAPLEGHTDVVRSVVFSPDGKRVASGSDDSTVRIWDAETGALATAPLEGHTRGVSSVVFSPDGTRVASGSDDSTVRIWDAETGALATAPLEGHTSRVYSVVFSPDGTRVASGSYDSTVRIWDAETGTLATAPLEGHTDVVRSVVFSPDGKRVASGSSDSTVRIWDAETGALAAAPLEGHSRWVNSVVFSPDGKRVASGSRDSTVRIWDAETGALATAPLEGHTDAVYSVVFSPDSRRLASGSNHRTVCIVDAEMRPSMVAFPERQGVASPADGPAMDISPLETSSPLCSPSTNHDTDICAAFSREPQHSFQVDSFLPHDKPVDPRDLFTMDDDGWITGPKGELIIWIPRLLRKYLWWPRTKAIMGGCEVYLDLSKFRHGTDWTQCRRDPEIDDRNAS